MDNPQSVTPPIDHEKWIATHFTGHGTAIRKQDATPIPGEPFMSMETAKNICRKALAIGTIHNSLSVSSDVTSEDRVVAWEHRPMPYKLADREAWMSGRYDEVEIIQDFAKHRTAQSDINEGELQARNLMQLARQRNDALARGDRLCEAATPFVSHYQAWMATYDDQVEMSVFARVTFGQVRALRDALSIDRVAPIKDSDSKTLRDKILATCDARIAVYEKKANESDAAADDDCNRHERMTGHIEAIRWLKEEIKATIDKYSFLEGI